MYNQPLQYTWRCKAFGELTAIELYGILQLRTDVFILEQNCLYRDVDGKDIKAFHLFASSEDKIHAYARILPPGISYDEVSIGRVVTSKAARNTGLGKLLMNKCMDFIKEKFPETPVRISAQSYLIKFYQEFGFNATGPEYLEDDIPHIQMLFQP